MGGSIEILRWPGLTLGQWHWLVGQQFVEWEMELVFQYLLAEERLKSNLRLLICIYFVLLLS